MSAFIFQESKNYDYNSKVAKILQLRFIKGGTWHWCKERWKGPTNMAKCEFVTIPRIELQQN